MFATHPAHAQNTPAPNYQYRIAVDNQFGSFTLPSINNKGNIAFAGSRTLVDGRVVSGIYATRGKSIIPIYQLDGAPGIPSDTIGNPSINNSGTVAFNGIVNGTAGVFSGNGGPLNTIFKGESLSVTINNSGDVSFISLLPDASDYAIYLGNTKSVSQVTVGQAPDLNDSGAISFYRPQPLNQQIYIVKNGVVTSLVKIPLRNGTPVINNAGTVAYSTELAFPFPPEEYPDLINAVYRIDNGQVTKVEDDTGAYSQFRQTGLNNSGKLIFFAFPKSAEIYGLYGIFDGPDPIANKVIAYGDELAGSRVTFVDLSKQAVNDKGEVAFLALLEDGRSVIAIATPRKSNAAQSSVMRSPF